MSIAVWTTANKDILNIPFFLSSRHPGPRERRKGNFYFMANRVIRDWTTSEAIDKLSLGAEVFFTRLIMKADDFGNYTGNWKLILAALFPFRSHNEAQIEVWIDELEAIGVVKRYSVDGKKYLHIPNFGQRLRTMSGKYPQPADKCPHSADNARPEENRNEVEKKLKGMIKQFSSDDYFESKEKAFEEIRDNQKYIEEDCVMILSGRGWKAVTPLDVIGLLKNFLNGKAKLENPKSEVRQHFKNWIGSGQTKLENLITLAEVFKKSL